MFSLNSLQGVVGDSRRDHYAGYCGGYLEFRRWLRYSKAILKEYSGTRDDVV